MIQRHARMVEYLNRLLIACITITVMLFIPFSKAKESLPNAILGAQVPLKGSELQYFQEDPTTAGYLSTPGGQPVRGGVILIHEWDGLTERVKATADAFADVGYVALAADLYQGQTGTSRAENLALMQTTRSNPERIIQNLNAALAAISEQPGVNSQVATIGWCFGGGIALSFALGGDHHAGTAIFYGQLLDDPERLGHLNHEVYGTFAGLDRGPSVDQVNAFVKALRDAGIPNDIHIYDEVQHGFWLHVDRDPARNRGPAEHAWHRLLAYLDRVLN
jgi:carboxymethylenebutenolidase